MNFLLDTCILSELYRGDRANPLVRKAVEDLPEEVFFISVITMGELVKGHYLLPEGRKKQGLQEWIHKTDKDFAQRTLPVDRDITQTWGEISARARKKGIQIPAADGLIAATALCHGLYLMTRNKKDFEATGVLIADPWANG